MISSATSLRYKLARTKAREVITLWEHRRLSPNDVFIASYGRSGTTWLRFVLLEILTGDSAGFLNVNKVIPEMGMHQNAPKLLSGGGRLIKTHYQYRTVYNKAVYLVRDLRDVCLSAYAMDNETGSAEYHSNGNGFDGYLKTFLEGRVTYQGAWDKHVRSWIGSPLSSRGDLLVIKFEDMRGRTEECVRAVLNFLGISCSDDKMRQAIANNSLQRMREKEEACHKAGIKLERGTLIRNLTVDREDGRFVRKGAVGGWRSKLTDAQLELIERHAGDTIVRMGYQLASSSYAMSDQRTTALPA